MSIHNYTTLTDDQLVVTLAALEDERDIVRQKIKALNGVRREREAIERAKLLYERMTPEERSAIVALHQTIFPTSVDGGDTVPTL